MAAKKLPKEVIIYWSGSGEEAYLAAASILGEIDLDETNHVGRYVLKEELDVETNVVTKITKRYDK